VAFDNLEFMSTRDRTGLQHHDRLYNLSGAPGNPNSGREFGQVIAEAAGLDGEGALAARDSDAFFGEDGFGFDDFLDLINPLQHIPIVSTLYRDLTGDEISPGARILGGALYGGPVGFAASIGNAAVEQVAGKDVGALALDLLDLGSGESEIASVDLAPAALPVGNDSDADILSRISPAAGLAPDATIAPLAAGAPEEDRFAGILTRRAETPDYLDRMSEAQKALLLSSVGLTPDETKRPNAAEAAAANVAAKVAATEKVTDRLDRVSAVEKPAERPVIRAAAGTNKVSFSGNKTGWQELTVPPGIDPNSPDWVAKAMMRALDKYEDSFGASGSRGEKLNSDI